MSNCWNSGIPGKNDLCPALLVSSNAPKGLNCGGCILRLRFWEDWLCPATWRDLGNPVYALLPEGEDFKKWLSCPPIGRWEIIKLQCSVWEENMEEARTWQAHILPRHWESGSIKIVFGGTVCTVVKAGGIFLLPRIFPSYFMKILQQIFRENVLHNISWHFSKSNLHFSELPHSMIYDEKFRDLLGRLSADIVLPFLFRNS